MILIGSRALKLRAYSLFKRQPKDFDFIATQDEVTTWLSKNLSKFKHFKAYSLEGKHDKYIVEGDSICEFELVKPNTSTEMLVNLVQSDKDTIETSFGLLPSLDVLFTIKSSHRHLKNSPFFWKNLSDYHLMKQMGAVVRPEFQAFLKLREKETYDYNHPKLNQNKKEFFSDDNISYKYDHDDIHKAVALYDRPAYTYYMKDGEQVFSDKEKFFACSREIQLAGVIEESSVLAVERSLVPHPGVMTAEQAWHFAFSKVCTSITSGWFREFAYENAPEILKSYPVDYFNKFQKSLSDGLIKPHAD
jgi:hypothetical protein